MVRSEEERFGAVLTGGLPRLEEALDAAAEAGASLRGDVAFRLYDTFGMPRDFIEDMAQDRRLAFDAAGFDQAMEGQREQARAKSAFKGGAAADAPWDARAGDAHGARGRRRPRVPRLRQHVHRHARSSRCSAPTGRRRPS